jgi:hypothetical protein
MATIGTRFARPRNESLPPANVPPTGTGVGSATVVVVVDPFGAVVDADGWVDDRPGPEP